MTVDLNEWNLSYAPAFGGNQSYDFGYSGDDSPFTVQVDVGDPDLITVDQQHGTDDAVLMGRDLLGGRDLTFTLTTLPDPSGSGAAINSLNKISEFGGVWRAPGVVHTPGRYATLTHQYRNRFVIGRPRQFTPKYARMRKGVVEYLAVFHTVSPDFYQNPMHSVNPVPTVNLVTNILGELPAWPVITFTGKFDTAALQWVPPVGFGPSWLISINHVMASNGVAIIDTRPWFRSARDGSGNMQNGWLSGTKMADCLLVPSTGGHFLFTTTGTTDANTKCTVTWYDAYPGL
jgi:hypothetical protein